MSAARACQRCPGRLMLHQEVGPYAGEEWRCVNCGYTDYGELVLRQSIEAMARHEAGGRQPRLPSRRPA